MNIDWEKIKKDCPEAYDKLYYKMQNKHIDNTEFKLNLLSNKFEIMFYSALCGRGFGFIIPFNMLYGLLESFFESYRFDLLDLLIEIKENCKKHNFPFNLKQAKEVVIEKAFSILNDMIKKGEVK